MSSLCRTDTLKTMMSSGRFIAAVSLVALVVVVLALALGWGVLQGDRSLLRDVSVAHPMITPDADGNEDITTISYTLNRNAAVSIYFEDSSGERYYFRQSQPRGVGDYQVYFSGIVEGYRLPGESYEGQIISRLLQNGTYNWVVEAAGETGETEREAGTLTIAEADTALPEMRDFTVFPLVFSPNQDGIKDHTYVSFDLKKDVERIQVSLLMPDGTQRPLPELPREARPKQRGFHTYDYEGGVNQNAAPPADGTYTVVARAEDAEGQKVQVEGQLTIELGGVPYATIVSPVSGDTLAVNTTAVQLCDTVYFTMTVENYGETPIRTTGPWSGTVYDSDWNYNTVGWSTESGAWRVGIGFENALSDFPFRWGLGSPDTLTEIDGYYYLLPGERAVVNGGVRVVGLFGVRNPQPVWGGLIHEDVAIPVRNNRVDPKDIKVDFPTPADGASCEPRSTPELAGQ